MLHRVKVRKPEPIVPVIDFKTHWIVMCRKVTKYAKSEGLVYVNHIGLQCLNEDQVADIKEIATECGYGDKVSVRQKSDGFYVTIGVTLRDDRSVSADWLSTDSAWGKSRRTPNNMIF